MMFCGPDSAADTSLPHRMPAVFCSSSGFPFESVLEGKYQVEVIFLVSVFQDAAWPRSVPRTEAVKQRNPYRLISSMSIAALATSHAVRRKSTNKNETTHKRRAELCTQGTASDSTSNPPAHPHSSTVPLLPWNTHSRRKLLVQLLVQLLPKAQQLCEQAADGLGHSDHTPQSLPCLTGLWDAGSEAWNSTE